MADNNLVRSRNDFRDIFADDDPLAELARIVGYEDRPAVKPEAPLGAAAPEPRREPALNLEDELLREFERYDAPRLDPVHDITLDEEPRGVVEPAPFVPGPSIEPQDLDSVPVEAGAAEPSVAFQPSYGEAFDHRDLDFGDEVAPPAFEAPVENVEAEPVEAEPVEAEPVVAVAPEPDRIEPVVDLPELPVMGEVSAVPQASFSEQDEQSAEEFDLAAELESSIGAAPVVESQPEERPEPKGRGGYVPGFRMPLANFAPASASAPRQEPIAPEPVAPPAFDLPHLEDFPTPEQEETSVAEAPASADPPISEPVAPADVWPAISVAPPAPLSLEPAPADNSRFSALDELIHDVQRYSLPAAGATAPAAVFAKAPEPAPSEPVAAPAAVTPAAPVAEAPAANIPTDAEKDPFSDEEFELALGDLELDLADIVAADTRKQPEEAAPAPAPAARVEIAPATPATPVVAAAPAVSEPEARDEAETVADLPFDPAQIADSEDQVEAIAELDVPALPAEEPEQQPAYKPDYDLDIDAELATLLMTPDKVEAAPARKPEIDIASAAKPAAGRSDQADRAPAYSDLDDFERALEEDFRRSLAAPLQPADHEEPRYAEADYLSTVEKARSSVRSWAVPAVVAGVVILGGVGAYAWLGNGVPGVGSGEPVIIAADTEPVKVAPENPGGKTVPNQDKAVYDRVAGVASQDPKQETLISSNEEPVDVVQKTLMPDTLPLEGENDIEPTDVGETEDPRLLPQDQQPEQVAAASAEQQPVTVMPRKVKTMVVRPDGRLVEQEVSAPAPALAAPESVKMPAAGEKLPEVAAAPVSAPVNPVQTQPARPAPGNGAAPVSAPATPSASEPFDPVAPAIELPPVQTAAASAAPAETAPAPQAPAEASDPAPVVRAPVPIARPSEQPVNVVAAVTDQGNVRASSQPAAAAPASTAAQTASLGDGGYVIQIASLPSQAEAQKSYQSLSAKFGSVIGGRGVDIKAADIAGKGTFYRVRIPAGSKNDAVSLCERYRAAGGSCLVAR